MRRLIPAAILASTLLGSGSVLAEGEEVYKWTDPQGVTLYAREAPPGVRADKVRINPAKAGVFDTPVYVDGRRNAAQQKPASTTAGAGEQHCPPVIAKCRKKGEPYVPSAPFVREPPEKDEKGRALY
jgi:hypothetical protein